MDSRVDLLPDPGDAKVTNKTKTLLIELENAMTAVQNADETNLHPRLRVLAAASTRLFQRIDHLESTIRHLWAGDVELVEAEGLEELL